MASLLSCASKVAARPMNGGSGLYSYSQNSSPQRKAIEDSKELINKSVSEELDMEKFSSLKTFIIADMGCSVGPNTLIAVQNIIDAVRERFDADGQSSSVPNFQVFFNDQASNDFNQLFVSLPPNKQYFAAGVPGSFYGRLFPDDSLHFVHSSCTSHWLSKVPDHVLDKSSPAWNKGKVQYSNSTDEVIMAYRDQFGKDMDNFLNLRAQEIVQGGLLALILPSRSNGTPHSKTFVSQMFEQLESSLVDMAKEGFINEEKIDSFNVPIYLASPEEVESIFHRNESFNVKMMEIIPHGEPQPEVIPSILRAIMEGTIKEHFGEEILYELFDTRLVKKFEGSLSITESCDSICLYVLLKRA